MLITRRGDRGPTVVALQILLNRSGQTDRVLAVDGIYGRETAGAAGSYIGQNAATGSGTAGGSTAGTAVWRQLLRQAGTRVIDSVDVLDPMLTDLRVADRLRAAGSHAFEIGGMSGGVRQMIHEVDARAGGSGSIALLRIIGHGRSGKMNVSTGIGGYFVRDGQIHDQVISGYDRAVNYRSEDHDAALSSRNASRLAAELSVLASRFAPYGSVQLHGCKVGRGRAGAQLLSILARAFGVPVSAGTSSQRVTSDEELFRHEGHVRTVYPGGGTLRTWAAAADAATPAMTAAP